MKNAENYNYAFLDEGSKREIRRCILKAVAIPGYQVPFGSRELPIGRGWGTGGIQLTLSLIGSDDTLKVIDQGSDESVNAVNIKKFVRLTTNAQVTSDTRKATQLGNEGGQQIADENLTARKFRMCRQISVTTPLPTPC